MGAPRRPGCICSAPSSGGPPRSCRRPAASAGSRSPPSETPESDRSLLQEDRRARRHGNTTPEPNTRQRGTPFSPTVLPSPHPLAGIVVRVVVGHLHLLLAPDAHDLLAVGVPQLLEQTQRAGWRPVLKVDRLQTAAKLVVHRDRDRVSQTPPPEPESGGGSNQDCDVRDGSTNQTLS